MAELEKKAQGGHGSLANDRKNSRIFIELISSEETAVVLFSFGRGRNEEFVEILSLPKNERIMSCLRNLLTYCGFCHHIPFCLDICHFTFVSDTDDSVPSGR